MTDAPDTPTAGGQAVKARETRALEDALAALLAGASASDERDGGDDARRASSDAVARALADPSGLADARRLQQTGALDPPRARSAASASESQARSPRPISIWRPKGAPDLPSDARVFERPAPKPFGDHYADRRRIRAAKPAGTRRVCFFGESVAAGYLYAPTVTPAKLLARALRLSPASTPGPSAEANAWEVVDLARTNERLDSLVSTLEASLQLAPDALVIFAGNNWTLLESPEWSSYAPSVRARLDVAEVLGGDANDPGRPDLWKLVSKAARAVFERGVQALARVARIADAASVPVVMVVPEVNQADWESCQPVPWLPATEGAARPTTLGPTTLGPTMQWHQLYEQAELMLARALESDTPDAAAGEELESLARAMLALDDGLCPTSFRLLAEAHRLREDRAAASEACRQEIAACHYATLAFLAAPQASPMAQALMRRAAAHHGFTCVDLPRLFGEATENALPGNRLFLDYCHLSSEGMGLAMAAVADAVRGCTVQERTNGSSPRPEVVSALVARVSPEVEATARLGAAIHCAHRLVSVRDPGPLLRTLLKQAIEASPNVIDTMVDLVDARTSRVAARTGPARHCPAVLTAAQQRMLGTGLTLGFQHGWRYPYLDVDVIEAIEATLEARADPRAQRVRQHVLRLAVDRCGDRCGAMDLLADGYFLARPLERLFPDVVPSPGQTGRAFLRTPWPTTRFVFVMDQPEALRFEIVARQPKQNGLAPGTVSPTTVSPATVSPATVSPATASPDRAASDRAGSHLETPATRLGVEINGAPVATVRLAASDAGSGQSSWQRHEVVVSASALQHGINRLTLRWPPISLDGETALRAAVDRLRRGIEADLHPIFGELATLRCDLIRQKSRFNV